MPHRQHIGTVIEEIDELGMRIKRLMKDEHLHDPRATKAEIDALVRRGHEIRGLIRGIEQRSQLNIAEFSRARGSFRANHPAYSEALKQAKMAYHDEVAVDRELAVCLTAIQHLDHESRSEALWAALPHVLHELEHVKGTLARLLVHLRRVDRLS